MTRICLSQKQRFGNRICQQLAGHAISEILGLEEPHGHRTPEIFPSQSVCTCTSDALILDGHKFDIELVRNLIRTKMYQRIYIRGWGMRLEYFKVSKERWIQESKLNELKPVHSISDDEVAVHIRLGDALLGKHFKYFPLPIEYYVKVIKDLGKEPVFIGEFGSNSEYEQTLKHQFQGAKFVSSDPLSDWVSLLYARTKVISISSFAWTAAWLGPENSKVILPIAGIFHPLINPTVDLLPWDDSRFEMRWLAPLKWDHQTSLTELHYGLTELSSNFPVVSAT